MAWNQPGGSGGKDPWGNRNNEQGPPDLDEVIRKLQGRLGGLFGGRGKGDGESSSGGGINGAGLGMIAAIAFVVWALSGIYIVHEGERGVVLQFGEFAKTTLPGPHWHPRFIQTVEVVNIDNVRSVELGLRKEQALMLTQDENIVDIQLAVQYRVAQPEAYLFNVREPDRALAEMTESAVREVVGKSELEFILTGGRQEVVARAHELVQGTLDQYGTGLELTELTMQSAQPPEQVQEAFADAVKAREDEQRLINEAEAYANEVIPRARGQAARIIEEANAYRESVIAQAQGETARFLAVLEEYRRAPEVTRQRLYIESMESVLTNSSKIFVDTEGGNNLLYLPLDRMIGGGAATAGTQSPQVQGGTAPRNEATDTRSRDSLRRREVR